VDPGVLGVGHSVKIALVHPKFDHSGGAERYALGLAGGLLAQGHEVHLFGKRAADLPFGVAFHRVTTVSLGRALKTWSFSAAASRALRADDFDIIQGFGKTVCQSVHRTGGGLHRAYLEREGTRRRWPYDKVVLRLEDDLFSRSSLRAVICPSTWVAQEVRRFYPAATDRIHIIPNGVDTQVFRPEVRPHERGELCKRLSISREAPLLLFAATNFQLKGLGLALESLSTLEEAHLLVAGGDDPSHFIEAARRKGVSGRVHFLGVVRDLAPVYRAADLLIHPTQYDPFANVCLEAMSCGTPVVTSDANGVADLLSEQTAGVVVPLSSDDEAWGEAALTLLRLGEVARAAARRLALEHGQEAHIGAVLSVYEEVAGAKDGRAGTP
jgi:UDP-glucose:(heptosyl)LPS alpha-1,3-glucosyltransferase